MTSHVCVWEQHNQRQDTPSWRRCFDSANSIPKKRKEIMRHFSLHAISKLQINSVRCCVHPDLPAELNFEHGSTQYGRATKLNRCVKSRLVSMCVCVCKFWTKIPEIASRKPEIIMWFGLRVLLIVFGSVLSEKPNRQRFTHPQEECRSRKKQLENRMRSRDSSEWLLMCGSACAQRNTKLRLITNVWCNR